MEKEAKFDRLPADEDPKITNDVMSQSLVSNQQAEQSIDKIIDNNQEEAFSPIRGSLLSSELSENKDKTEEASSKGMQKVLVNIQRKSKKLELKTNITRLAFFPK